MLDASRGLAGCGVYPAAADVREWTLCMGLGCLAEVPVHVHHIIIIIVIIIKWAYF